MFLAKNKNAGLPHRRVTVFRAGHGAAAPPDPTAYVTSVTAEATGGSTAQLDIVAGPDGATVYPGLWLVGTVPTDREDVKAGTGAAWHTSFTTPGAFSGPSGLDPSTAYEPAAVAEYDNVLSEITVGDSFTTEAVDSTAPVLSAPSVIILDETSAELRWETDEQRGISHVVVSTDSTTPNVGQVAAGLDGTGAAAVWAAGGGSGQAVAASAAQSATATGLAAVAHYAWVMQYDPSLNASNVLALGSFTPADVTAPIVTSPEAAVSGSYAATVQFNSDEAGTGYVVFTDDATTPTADEIIAGEDHTGTPVKAGEAVSLAVSAGHTSQVMGDLEGGVTGYRAHICVVDAAGNKSVAVTTTNSFNTAAAAVPGAFGSGDWALADAGTGGALDVTISALPARNGAGITDVEYRIDGGSWVSSGGIVGFTISSGLTDDVEADIELRAINSAGNGAASDLKSETPTGGTWLPSDETLLAWIDSADTSTTFQDNAETTPAGLSDPVSRINDKVNGNYYRTTTAGTRPILTAGGLDFDGADDHLRSSSAVNLSSYNQITVFAVVEGDTDGASQIIVEFGSGTGTGRFYLMRDTDKYAIAGRGGASPNANQRADSSASYGALDLSVIVATFDIPNDANTLYINGSQDGQATGDQGTGNFASTDLLNIGARNEGSSLFFNGRIAEIGIIAGVADATLRSNIVSYAASKWGVS